MIAAATYTLPESFSLPAKDYIYRACGSLISQHPGLSAIPVGEDTKNPYFVRVPQIDLDQAIIFQEREKTLDPDSDQDPELESLITAQHNTGFTPPAPFWRLCILTDGSSSWRQFTAVFVYHHALGDGSSGKSFHRTFLQALRDASLSTSETKQVVPSPNSPLLPNLEALHPLPVSLPFLLKVFFQAKIWSSRPAGLWTGGKVQFPVSTQARHFAFSRTLTSSLKSLCHSHSTTITALLETVIARSLLRHLEPTYTTLKCCNAVSTRRWLPDVVTDDSIGVWVEDFAQWYDRNATSGVEFPWTEAQRSRKAIEHTLEQRGKNASSNLLRYVRDFHHELFLSQLGRERATSYEISNLGIVGIGAAKQGEGEGEGDVDEKSRPTLGRMVFSQSANLVGGAIMVSSVTGGDGCLSVTFTWQRGIVEEELIERVIGSMREEFNSLSLQ